MFDSATLTVDEDYEAVDAGLALIVAAIETLRGSKPNDRSAKDRAYAVTITELEKALAYYSMFAMDDAPAN